MKYHKPKMIWSGETVTSIQATSDKALIILINSLDLSPLFAIATFETDE
jgi:hypothetical protein